MNMYIIEKYGENYKKVLKQLIWRQIEVIFRQTESWGYEANEYGHEAIKNKGADSDYKKKSIFWSGQILRRSNINP